MYLLKPPEDPTLSPLVHSLLPTPPRFEGYNSYYHNVSGFLNGPSKFYNLTSLHNASLPTSNESVLPSWYPFADQFSKHAQINATEVAERVGAYNWTGIDKITITIMEFRREDNVESPRSTKMLTLLHVCIIYEILLHLFWLYDQGKIELSNPSGNSELRFQIDGVHFPANGTFVGFAIPKGHVSFIISSVVLPCITYSDG